jgi:hypothetical protein
MGIIVFLSSFEYINESILSLLEGGNWPTTFREFSDNLALLAKG